MKLMIIGSQPLAYLPALVERMRFLLDYFDTLTERPFWPWVIPVVAGILAVWMLIRTKSR